MNLIYAIINNVNLKVYVGSTKDPDTRIMQHISGLNGNRHENSHLQYSWNKYGEESFGFAVLEVVKFIDLIPREIFWINEFNCCDDGFGYNLAVPDEEMIGFIASPETRKKLSEAQKKQAKLPGSFEKRSRASKGNQTWLGRKHTKESIERNRQSHLGKKHSKETRDKMKKAWKSRKKRYRPGNLKWSDEKRERMSKVLSKAWRGRRERGYGTPTKETLKKMSIGQKKRQDKIRKEKKVCA